MALKIPIVNKLPLVMMMELKNEFQYLTVEEVMILVIFFQNISNDPAVDNGSAIIWFAVLVAFKMINANGAKKNNNNRNVAISM